MTPPERLPAALPPLGRSARSGSARSGSARSGAARSGAARRRAGSALAAVGLLSLVGAAPADPPALAAPGAAGDAFSGSALSAPAASDPGLIPGLAAPAESYESTRTPAPTLRAEPLRTESWRSLAAPSDAGAPVVATPERFAAPEEDADEDKTERRGWLSFSPRRIRTASNFAGFTDFGDSFGLGGTGGGTVLYGESEGGSYGGDSGYETPTLAPQPDPISSPRTAYRSQDLEDVGPAPAPRPVPMDPADAGPVGDDDFRPVPPRTVPPAPAAAPPRRPSLTLPSDTVIRNGVPVRDLRTPEPSPYAPYVDGDARPYGAPLPPTGTPFGEPYGGRLGNPYAGPAGLGAGPLAPLGSAGGMCELGLCDGVVPLFTRLEIEDPDHVHPAAVRQVVAVADPTRPAPPIGLAKLFHRECTGCRQGCRECDPLCDDGAALVFVEVCVPPCRPEEVKVTRHGHRVHMDFGKYEVTLTGRDGYVKVDYDD
ncbi:hypothetical protein [Alienimonas sp. DA493]|uniref:hypothetical protein n=1 Tax=Alienimonas sp. DA493 TaxID=3373605 RepID=UPI003754BF1B